MPVPRRLERANQAITDMIGDRSISRGTLIEHLEALVELCESQIQALKEEDEAEA